MSNDNFELRDYHPRPIDLRVGDEDLAVHVEGVASWARISFRFNTSRWERIEIYRNTKGFPSRARDHLVSEAGDCIVSQRDPGTTIERVLPDTPYYYSAYVFKRSNQLEKLLGEILHSEEVAILHFKLIYPSLESLEGLATREPPRKRLTIETVNRNVDAIVRITQQQNAQLKRIDHQPDLDEETRERLKEIVRGQFEAAIEEIERDTHQ